MATTAAPSGIADPVQNILSRLDGVRRSGSGFTARCPAHEDSEPSLSVGYGNDGRALIRCFRGCATEDIVAAIGLTMADLFPDDQGRNGAGDSRFARPTKRTKRESEKGEKSPRRETRRIEYEIRDIDRVVQARHVRVEYDDGSKKFIWQRPDGRNGLDGRSVESMPLYRSEDLKDLPDGATVVVTEGEKACLAVLAAGIPAVATVTGASTAPSADVLACLTRFDVVLWPDNDDAGAEHMNAVAERLISLGMEP